MRGLWYFMREGQSRRAVDGIPLGMVIGSILTLIAVGLSGHLP